MPLTKIVRSLTRAAIAHGTLFSYAAALFAPAFMESGAFAASTGNRYSASLCGRHVGDPVEEAKPVLVKTKPGCTKAIEETKYFETFFAGSDEKEAFGKRTEALIKEAHGNVQAYVNASNGDINQTTAGSDVQELLTKMRASRTKLEELMKELGAVYERIRKDKVELVPLEAIALKPLNEIQKTARGLKEKYGLAQSSIAQFTEAQNKAKQDIASAQAQNSSTRVAETNLQQATSRITGLQANMKSWTADMERFNKAVDQIKAATTDVLQDHRALELAGTDWNKEAQRIKVAQYRITFADPTTAANDRENARKGLVDIQKSSVITAQGASSSTDGSAPVAGASTSSSTTLGPTADQARLAQLAKGTESGDQYLDTNAMLEKAIKEGKQGPQSFGNGDVVEQTLNASQDSALKGVRKDTEYFMDDAGRTAAREHLTAALDKVQGPLADIYGSPTQVKKPDADAGFMSRMVTSYEPADSVRDKVNGDYDRYNAAVAKLTPEEREYWRNEMKMPLEMSDKELYYSKTMAAHGDGSDGGYVSGALDFGKGLWTGGVSKVSGDPVTVQDPGSVTVARNRMPGSEGAFQNQLGDQLVNSIQEKTYRATGNADTMSNPQYFRNVALPEAMAKVTPDWAKDYGFGEGSGNLEKVRSGYLESRDSAARLTSQASNTPVVVPGYGVITTADMAAEATERTKRLGFSALESNSPYMAQVLVSNPELTRQAVDLSTVQATALHGDSAFGLSQTKHTAGEFVGGFTGPWGQESLAQSSQNKAVMLTAAAQEFHTSTLENAAAKAREAAQSNRNMTWVAAGMTLTGQTVLTGALMKAGKAAYMEASTGAMIVREASVAARVIDNGARASEVVREVARPVESVAIRTVDTGITGGSRIGSETLREVPKANPDNFVSHVHDLPETISAPTAFVSHAAPLVDRSLVTVAHSTEAPFVAAAEHLAPTAERFAPAVERVVPAVERIAAPAERSLASAAPTARTFSEGAHVAQELSRNAATGASHATEAAHSAAEAAQQGSSRISSAVVNGLRAPEKVADPAATVSSSSFLARVAESVGWSGQRMATVSAAGLPAASRLLVQGERGVQEIEHLARSASEAERAGTAVEHAARTGSEGAGVLRPAEQVASESTKAVRLTEVSEKAVTVAVRDESAVHVAESAVEAASPVEKIAKFKEETGQSAGAITAAAKDLELAEKQVATAAKDEALGVKESINARSFAAKAEKMLKPGGATDRYLDHITNLGAIKAAAMKDPVYLARLAKEEGTTSGAFLKKLDRRIDYFEHQLHEKYAFPKTYMEQFKEASLHGGFKPEELADVKRLLTQRAVLESSVAKTLVNSAAKKVEAAMKAAVEGGDRAALEKALIAAKVPEKLAARVREAIDTAKLANRLDNPELRAAIPAIARDLAGAAVLTKNAPQVGHDLFENLGMIFRPSNHMVAGLTHGMIQSYVSNPLVRAGTWIVERPGWFRGVPKYAVKDFSQMELEARLAKAALTSGEKLTADVRRMGRIAEEADGVQETVAKEEAAARQAKSIEAESAELFYSPDTEIATSSRFMGTVVTEPMYHPVQQIAPDNKLTAMLLDSKNFSREKYYMGASETFNVPSYVAAQGLSDFKVYPRINDALTKIGAPFRALLMDPGTITHGNEFAHFIETSKTTWKDPSELRRAIVAEMGTVKVYRAMALAPNVAADILSKGLAPAGLRSGEFSGAARMMGTSIEGSLKRHMLNTNTESMAISFSKRDPELGVALANQELAKLKLKNPDAAVYMMEGNLNRFDLIYYTPDGIPASPGYADLMRGETGITYDGKPLMISRGGPGQESLMYLPVSPDQITSLKKVENGEKYGYVMPAEMAADVKTWEKIPNYSPVLTAELKGNHGTPTAERIFADLGSDPAKVTSTSGAFAVADKISAPIVGVKEAAFANPLVKIPALSDGSLLARSNQLGNKIEDTVRSLLDSGQEVDLVRRQLKVENAVRALITDDKIPEAEVEKLRSMVNGGKVPSFTPKQISERSMELAQARFLSDANVAPKVVSLERSLKDALIAAAKSGDLSALHNLGVDEERAGKLVAAEKLFPGVLAKQGATHNLAESIVLSRDAGEALGKNRWLNSTERMRRFATGSAQLSSALVVGSARGIWSGAKWAASFADRESAKNYWAAKLGGYGLDSAKDLDQAKLTIASLKALNKLGRSDDLQGTAYWMLVGAGEKSDAASRVAREAALGALRDSGLSNEAVGMVHAEALLHVKDPLSLSPVKSVSSLEDVLRKRDLEPAAGMIFTRTAGLNDSVSTAARASAEKALLDSGWTHEEVTALKAESNEARKALDSQAKASVRELIDLAQVPEGMADSRVKMVQDSLRSAGYGDAAIEGVNKLIQRDSADLRKMLAGSPRDSGSVVAGTLKAMSKDYEALLMPSKFKNPEQEAASVAKMFEKLDREPGVAHAGRATVEEKLKRLEAEGVVVSTNGVRSNEGVLMAQAEGGVGRTESGLVQLSTHESAIKRGQLAAEEMLAHETVHVRSLQMANEIETLEGKLSSTDSAVRGSAASRLAEASGRSIFIKSLDGAPVVLKSDYLAGFALDEVQAHLEGARKETALARMYLTQDSNREALLRASAGLGFAKDSLARAEEFNGAGRVTVEAARDLVKASAGELRYDAATGGAVAEITSGARKISVKMSLARGLTGEQAAQRFVAASDFTLQKLQTDAEKSRAYLAQESARLRTRVANGDFGKLGGGAYANAQPTRVRGMQMYTPAALAKADPAVREAVKLRNSVEASQTLSRHAALGRASTPVDRFPLLKAEEDYLARNLAVAKDELRAGYSPAAEQRVADLEKAHAGISAQLIGERKALRVEIAGSSGPAVVIGYEKSLDTSLFARYADRFPGKTLDEVAKDPVLSSLFKALNERDVILDAKVARESTDSIAEIISRRIPAAEEPARAQTMAAELAEAQAEAASSRGAASREKSVTETLTAKGWSPEQVSGCFAEGICAPKLETTMAKTAGEEVSPAARAILVADAIEHANPKAVEEARSIARIPEKSSTLDELKDQKATLAKEADAKSAALAAKPSDPLAIAALADVKRAEVVVGQQIVKAALAKTELLSKLSAEDVKLEKLGQNAVMDYIKGLVEKSVDRDVVNQIDPRLGAESLLKGLNAGRWGPGNTYDEFTKIASGMDLPKRAALFDVIKGSGKAADKAVAPAASNAKAAQDLEKAALVKKAALAEIDNLKAQTKAVVAAEARVASGRRVASIEGLSVKSIVDRDISRIPLNVDERASLQKAILLMEPDAKTAVARMNRMQALAANPQNFETYRMAYESAATAFHDAGLKGAGITREKAWDAGVRQMLLDSKYSKDEIEGGMLAKTELCLTL